MKQTAIFVFLLFFSTILPALGQKISETNFAFGISSSSLSQQQWNNERNPTATYLNFGTTKSWHNDEHKLSLRKEIGLNLQYADINHSGGGLGAGNHYTGNIVSLFADVCLQVRFRIDSLWAIGLGPEAEYLLAGANNLNNSYYTMLTNPPSAGNKSISGVNRDYFNKPSLGVKLSIFETKFSERATLGLNLSYLWTKQDASNFYASNYLKISLVLELHRKKVVTSTKME